MAVLAAFLAAVAMVLATIANRRWVRSSRLDRTSPTTNGAATRAAAAASRRMAEHDSQLSAQESQLTTHAADLRELRADVAEHDSQLAAQESQLATHAADLRELRAEVAELTAEASAAQTQSVDLAQEVAAVAAAARTALRRVAIVRYDAFSDVGGRLSYSTAILDDTATGLVITSLAGKADVRTYVKAVSGGLGKPDLTPEEEQAVVAAAGATP